MIENEVFQILGMKLLYYTNIYANFSYQSPPNIIQARSLYMKIISGFTQRALGLEYVVSRNNISVLNIFQYQLNNLTATLSISNTNATAPSTTEIQTLSENITLLTSTMQSIGKWNIFKNHKKHTLCSFVFLKTNCFC